MLCQFELEELREIVEAAHTAGLPVTAHAHGLPAVLMAMAAAVDGIEHGSFLTDKGPAQTDDDLDRLARAGYHGVPDPRLPGNSGINAAKPHGLLPLSIAVLVEGGVDTLAALASATPLAAAACGLGDSTGRLCAGYAADVLVVEGNVVADIAALQRPTATFAAGHKVDPAALRSS